MLLSASFSLHFMTQSYYVVFITGRGAQRRVQEIVRVWKHDGKEYVTEAVE